jgi:hypothetical protein
MPFHPAYPMPVVIIRLKRRMGSGAYTSMARKTIANMLDTTINTTPSSNTGM